MDEQIFDTMDEDHNDDFELMLASKPRKTRKRKKKEVQKNYVPSVQRAWKVGYSAAQANLPETRNPFLDISSEEHSAWLEGWWSGFYDEPLHVALGTAIQVA